MWVSMSFVFTRASQANSLNDLQAELQERLLEKLNRLCELQTTESVPR